MKCCQTSNAAELLIDACRLLTKRYTFCTSQLIKQTKNPRVQLSGAYLGNIKEYALGEGGAPVGNPYKDIRGKKTIIGGKKTVVEHFTEMK